MSTFSRMAYGFYATIGIAIGGLMYNEVYLNNLREVGPTEGIWAQPLELLDYIVPFVLLTILLAVWVWVIIGSVQEERSRDVRQVRRP